MADKELDELGEGERDCGRERERNRVKKAKN
jgi:hypothetical protein